MFPFIETFHLCHYCQLTICMNLIRPEQGQKHVFHQFEVVNLEAQNPRRDASIPSVCSGLAQCCNRGLRVPQTHLHHALCQSYNTVTNSAKEEQQLESTKATRVGIPGKAPNPWPSSMKTKTRRGSPVGDIHSKCELFSLGLHFHFGNCSKLRL